MLLFALIGTAVLWAAVTRVNLVVAAAGRVRPESTPQKVSVARTDGPTGKVAEVFFTQGQPVRAGDLLLRLDTERLRSEIARKRRAIRGGEEELEKGDRLAELQHRQAKAALDKLDTEIAQAVEEVKRATDERDAERRLARAELRDAAREEEALTRLAQQQAVSQSEVLKASAKRREAETRLEKANLPVDEGKVAVLRKARQLAAEENAIRAQETAVKKTLRVSEVEAGRIEAAALEAELKQAELHAPLSGVVTSPGVKVGDVVEPGRPILEIADHGGFRVEFLVGSDEVENLKVGMAVTVKLEAFDYQKYGTLGGTIEFISPDSAAVEGRPGVAYTVRARVNSDTVGRGPMVGQVKLGMAGQVEVVTGEDSVLELLFKKITHRVRLK